MNDKNGFSTWVPLEVTVMFKLMPVHDPGVPQSVGGLDKNVIETKKKFHSNRRTCIEQF